MSCRLSLFGPPTLLDEDGRPVPIPAKAFALVAHILLSSGAPISRAAARQFLWEDADAKTAATNLRKFLLRIRQRQEEFGIEFLREERSHIRVAPTAEIDLTRFLQLVSKRGAVDLIKLCEVYRGELLEGLLLEEPEGREWLQVRRTKLRDTFIAVVTEQLDGEHPGTDRMALRIAARRLIEVDPYGEAGYRALMRLYAEERERGRVQDIYLSLQERLREDLGIDPDPATTELYRSLLPAQATMPILPAQPIAAQPASAEDGAGEEIAADATSGSSGVPKVTVLPPPPIGTHSYHHQIAVSLIEDVAIGLCRFRGLSAVAPHTSAELSFGGKKALFRNFGIDYAVETQLQDRAGEIWLSVKLINARSRKILWADQYEFNREAIARQYRELSVRVVLLLVDRIERAELSRYDVEQNPTAYHLFLRGQRFLRALDLPNVRRARREFRNAISVCSDFVPAITSLARTYQREWLLLARGDRELLTESERLARIAIECDPDDARGYRELGNCTLFTGRFDESLRAFELAEQRNPQHADLLADLADALSHACEPAAALQKITKAIDLNPLCPDHYWWAAGGANFHLKRYADAIQCMSRMRDQSPAYRLMAASWAMLGNREQAAEYVRKTKDIHPDFSVNGWLSILPIRDAAYAQHYAQSLREAGFE